MSSVDFQLVDDEKIDDSILKQNFIKPYHESGADLKSEKSKIKFYFAKKNNFIPGGNELFEFDIKITKANNDNFSSLLPDMMLSD